MREPRAGLDTLRKLHGEMLEYVKTTQEDLRAHFVRGGSDAYQWLLLISTTTSGTSADSGDQGGPQVPKK